MLLKGRAAMSALTTGAVMFGAASEHLLGGRIRIDDAERFSHLRGRRRSDEQHAPIAPIAPDCTYALFHLSLLKYA